MTEDELFDLLTELEETVPLRDKPRRFEGAAAEVAVGEHGRGSLLIAAGEHHQMAGSYDDARRCFDAAAADGGEGMTEPVANLHSLALTIGDEEEAKSHLQWLLEQVRGGHGTVPTCHFVGETLETHGRLREAVRWFTIPLTRVDDEAELDPLCLAGRRRVRRELGMAPDRLDLLAEAELESHRG